MAFFELSFLSKGTPQLEKLRGVLSGIGQQSYKTFDAMARSMQHLDKVTGRTISTLAAFAGGGYITQGLKIITHSLYQSNSMIVTNRIMLEELLGSAQKAKGFIKTVQDISGLFGADMSEMMSASRGMIQMFNQIGGGKATPQHLDKMLKLIQTASLLDTENRGLAYTAFSFKEALQGIGQGDWRSMKNRLEINIGKTYEQAITKAVKSHNLDQVVKLFDEAFKKIGLNADSMIKRIMNEGLTQNLARTLTYISRTMQMVGESSYLALAKPFARLNTFIAKQFEMGDEKGVGKSSFMKMVESTSEHIKDVFVTPFAQSMDLVTKSLKVHLFEIFNGLKSIAMGAITLFGGIITPFLAFTKGLLGMENSITKSDDVFKSFGATATKIGSTMKSIGNFFIQLRDPIYELGQSVRGLVAALAELFHIKGMSAKNTGNTAADLLGFTSTAVNATSSGIGIMHSLEPAILGAMMGTMFKGGKGAGIGAVVGSGMGAVMPNADEFINLVMLASMFMPFMKRGGHKAISSVAGVGAAEVSKIMSSPSVEKEIAKKFGRYEDSGNWQKFGKNNSLYVDAMGHSQNAYSAAVVERNLKHNEIRLSNQEIAIERDKLRIHVQKIREETSQQIAELKAYNQSNAGFKDNLFGSSSSRKTKAISDPRALSIFKNNEKISRLTEILQREERFVAIQDLELKSKFQKGLPNISRNFFLGENITDGNNNRTGQLRFQANGQNGRARQAVLNNEISEQMIASALIKNKIGNMSTMQKVAGFAESGIGTAVNGLFGASLLKQFGVTLNGVGTSLSSFFANSVVRTFGLLGAAVGVLIWDFKVMNDQIEALNKIKQNELDIEHEKQQQEQLKHQSNQISKVLGGNLGIGNINQLIASNPILSKGIGNWQDLQAFALYGDKKHIASPEKSLSMFESLWKLKSKGQLHEGDVQPNVWGAINSKESPLTMYHEHTVKLDKKDSDEVLKALTQSLVKKGYFADTSKKVSANMSYQEGLVTGIGTSGN